MSDARVESSASRRRSLALGALAGLAIGLGGAPHEAWAVALAGPGLFTAALVASSGDAPSSARSALAVGLTTGTAANALTCSWIVELVTAHVPLPPLVVALVGWLAAAGVALVQSAPFVLTALVAHVVLRALEARARTALLALVPLAWTAVASATPMLFPWRLGHALLGQLALVQLAEVQGLPLVDLLYVVASSLVVTGALALARSAAHARRALAGVAVFAAMFALGHARLAQIERERDAGEPLVVGVVQHAFTVAERFDRSRWNDQQAITWALTRALEAEGVDLVTWPESAFPWPVSAYRLRELPHDLALRSAGVRGPLVLGGTRLGRGDARFNSVFAVDRERLLGVVDKVRLMPFSERVPLWEYLTPLHSFIGPGLTPGTPPGPASVLSVADAELGILDCYEDLFDDHVRSVVAGGADVLSNHTNDAWFGRTNAPALHFFLARMRAIETRRDLVRTVNTGVSGLVASTGASRVASDVFTRTTLRVTARRQHTITPWVALGDRVTPAAQLVLLALLALGLARRVLGARTTP